MHLQQIPALLAALVAISSGNDCWAWGATGHEWVGGVAIEKLPDSVPEFIRTPEAAADIAVMGRKLDRSRGAGKTHDAERDPGHYINLAEEWRRRGRAAAQQASDHPRGIRHASLPEKGFTQYKAGYLPYSIIDGWQQIRKDFAYWRALTKAIRRQRCLRSAHGSRPIAAYGRS